MYEKFYAFSEKPFNTTPDSRFFFPSTKHQEALNSLIYAINERKGFVVITGEIGAGKTTVCRTLLNKLDINTRVATITNTHLTCKELIAEILEEFQVNYAPGTKQKLLSQLNAFLIKQLAAGINVILIIDEAQNLSTKVLEEVRMLSNLETEKEKLIQIILVGQPQLKEKLKNIRLEQFKQRVAVFYHLSSLNRQETQNYISHRLKLVSANGTYDLFNSEAIDLVHQHSNGIPRVINLICDSALLSGYIYDVKKITEKIIDEVIKEKDLGTSPDDATQYAIRHTQYDTRNTQYDIRNTTHAIYCCPKCKKYSTCEIKWERGIKGEEQICCSKCQEFKHCQTNAKKK
ncbi:MAG: AAA family ATPase [Candidatus Omnitrophota bacterium]